jgi:hypothetical protein
MYLFAFWYAVFLAGGTAGALIGLNFGDSAFAPSLLLGMAASGYATYPLSQFLFAADEQRERAAPAATWPDRREIHETRRLPRLTGGGPSLRRLAEAVDRLSQTAHLLRR